MSVLLAVIVFSSVILLLSFMLIGARKRLVPQGDVNIIINGDTENPLKVQPGVTLLGALSDQSVFLPSACGGGGTCAMCECHIDVGGGDVLPTEMNHLTRKEAAENSNRQVQNMMSFGFIVIFKIKINSHQTYKIYRDRIYI